MKLQLLLVLAVAALVPSLSEGRVFSKCELKTIFQKAITLPGKFKQHKQELLAAIICQLNATSGLNSNLVTVKGTRGSSTPAVTTFPVATGNPTGPANPTTNPTTNTTGTPILPTTTTSTNIAQTTLSTNIAQTTLSTNIAQITSSTNIAQITSSTNIAQTTSSTNIAQTTTIPTNVTAAGVTTAELVSPNSSTPSGIRRRRSASRSQKKEKESESSDKSLFDLKWECDTQQGEEDDNGMRKRGSAESSEEDQQTTVSSLGKYGIFQMSDSYSCDSGYRWSRNVCHADCSVFTDDDISDDTECFLESINLGCFMKLIPRFCFDQAKTYFNDCT